MSEYPKYLYHYTSIDNLALILKNRTIRFNSLINVDDPNEIKTVDTDGIGKYCYCSCWTDKEESIPFWNMYTKDMHGVMIKMVSFPFESHEEFLSYFGDNGSWVETYIPREVYTSNNVYTIPTIPFLRKIQYVKDPKVKVFDMVSQNADGTFNTVGNMNDVGLYKTLAWDFQSEWRYSMLLLPHNKFGALDIDVSNQNIGLLKSYYDIKIADIAFETMEIVTGPKINAGEKLLLESICEKYAPNARISNSVLKIQ